jgi:hypothetical protein
MRMESALVRLVLEVPGPELLAQPKLLDLSRWSPGELGDDPDRLRPFLLGEMAG